MKGYIEVHEDDYDDVIEHLKRIKLISCKLIKMLSEHSDVYEEEEPRRKTHSRYEY